ncbi:ribosome recycling factor domain-containing protein [Xylaria nigripes]|nr:ribosome recycling factor domain-containing protein [Xylaria nigripes]
MCQIAARGLMRRAFTQSRPGTRPIGPPNALLGSRAAATRAITTAAYGTQSLTRQGHRVHLVDFSRRDLILSARAFHSTPPARKVKKKPEQQQQQQQTTTTTAATDADDGAKHPKPTPEEPLNFADVESRLQKHAEHFRFALKKTNASGRFDPDVVGSLRVQVDKKASTTYPLRELAQVVPRGGRTVSLLVHDAEYVKPIMSAVQASADFNQQPQRDADNELELILKIELDKPEDMVRRIKTVAHEWRERIQAVRQKRIKQHETWKKGGEIGPDLKRMADDKLGKIIKDATAEVDTLEKNATKAIKS